MASLEMMLFNASLSIYFHQDFSYIYIYSTCWLYMYIQILYIYIWSYPLIQLHSIPLLPSLLFNSPCFGFHSGRQHSPLSSYVSEYSQGMAVFEQSTELLLSPGAGSRIFWEVSLYAYRCLMFVFFCMCLVTHGFLEIIVFHDFFRWVFWDWEGLRINLFFWMMVQLRSTALKRFK